MDEERQPGRDDEEEAAAQFVPDPQDATSSPPSSSHGGAVPPVMDSRQEDVVAPGFPVGSREWYQALPSMAGTKLDHIPTAADMALDASRPGGVSDDASGEMEVGEVTIGEVSKMIGEIEAWIQEIQEDIIKKDAEEAEEDLQGLTGVSDLSISSSFFETVKGRFSWLILNMLTAILASSVIGLFQEEIEKLVALAVLMPIVASMGGNAGTQTVTVAVRALATRQLNYTNLQKFVLKETWVGLLNGFLFALLSALLAYLWFDDKLIAIIMGLAMIANLLFAGVLGTLIPLTLEKFKIDPAISSSVFLTTATDVIGFFTFLGLSAIIIL